MDRLCDCISNLRLAEKKNAIVSLIAGALVSKCQIFWK
jgi:hypothetical protein